MTANNVYSLKSLDTNVRGIVREAISINGFSCISHHEGFGTTPFQKNVFIDQDKFRAINYKSSKINPIEAAEDILIHCGFSQEQINSWGLYPSELMNVAKYFSNKKAQRLDSIYNTILKVFKQDQKNRKQMRENAKRSIRSKMATMTVEF